MPAPWPKEEIEYLEDKWGHISITAVSKKLNRSINAVKLKAGRLGLGRHLHSGDYITLNQLYKALGITGSTGYKNISWIKAGLPIKHKKVINNSFRVIYIRDFWKWAELNKMLIDFSRLEPYTLGPEPDWVGEKRKADFLAAQYKTTPWTPKEDSLLVHMLNAYRYSYREISIKLKRTEGAIKRRMRDLRLKQRPLKADNHNPWTDEETEILIDMYYRGYIAEVMAEKIPRSALAIKGKIERMIKDGELSPNRLDPNKEPSRLPREKAGVSYKEVLPKDTWPEIHRFLSSLNHYSSVAKEQNSKLDIGGFMKAYVDTSAGCGGAL